MPTAPSAAGLPAGPPSPPTVPTAAESDAITKIRPSDVSIPDDSASCGSDSAGTPPPDSPGTLSRGHRTFRQKAEHLWHGLPTAAKTTLILAVVGTILLVAYAITSVSLRSYDEEAHVSTVMVVYSIFILYTVFDAVIYENTIQLIISIVLTALMLARILWFVATRPTTTTLLPLKIVWGSVVAGVLLAFILAALLSCRQFGWRLYSRLGVDYRRKDATRLQRLSFIAHLFNALVKLDFIMLVTVCAVGITVAREKRVSVDMVMLGTVIGVFFVNVALEVCAVVVAATENANKQFRRLVLFNLLFPLAIAGPVAMIVIYDRHNDTDVANAHQSLDISCALFMATRLALTITLNLVCGKTETMAVKGGRVMVRATQGAAHSDTALTPLLEGAWLGKPEPRNPKKIRFFQLSHDGTTLRWGWHKFVRLYYSQGIEVNESAMTLTLTFLLDPELTLGFQDLKTLELWRRGLEHATELLLRPDGAPGGVSGGRAAVAPAPGLSGARSRSRRRSSTEHRERDDVLVDLEEGMKGMISSSMRRLGKSFSRAGSGASAGSRLSEDGSAVGSAEPHTPKALSGTPSRLSNAAPSAGQLQKRQRMAAFLASAAATMGRLGGFAQPGTPSGRTPAPARRGSGASRTDSGATGEEELSLDLLEDDEAVGWGGGSGSGRKRRRAVVMVSAGTQTDDADFSGVSEASSSAPPPETPAAADAALADEYANLMAAAMAAMSAGAGAGAGGAGSPAIGASPPPPAAAPLVSRPVRLSDSSPGSHPRLSSSPSHSLALALNRGGGSPGTLSSPSGGGIGTPLSPTSPAGAPPLAISVDVIEFEELAMGKLLGAGSEGAVYAAWYLETPVAVKRFNRVEDSLHEVGMYLGVGSHDNVVALRALCQHEGAMYLVLEFCPRGTLDTMLHYSAPRQWDPARLLPLVRSIARGMHHLHARGIVHRDLKPANVFVGHGQTMKVGDFGMAKYVGGPAGAAELDKESSLGLVGTAQYAAPELVNEDLRPDDYADDAEWAKKLDVWSFGVTLWEIMERRRPFEGVSQLGIQALWLNNPYEARLPPVKVPDGLDPGAKLVLRGLGDLVEDCTRVDPMQRPTFGTVLRRLRLLAQRGSTTS